MASLRAIRTRPVPKASPCRSNDFSSVLQGLDVRALVLSRWSASPFSEEDRTVGQHNEVVRESFTTQALAFAANPWVTDELRIQRLVAAARLTGNERVLDIATG